MTAVSLGWSAATLTATWGGPMLRRRAGRLMQRIEIHKKNPNARDVRIAAERLEKGAVISYPTDTVYALGCDIQNRKALERLYQLKTLPKNHHMTFLCSDISEIAAYGIVANTAYRLMRRLLPGPYTFILEAGRSVPHTLLNKRRTIGVRIPDHEVPLALVKALGRPLVTTSAVNEENEALGDPDAVEERYGNGLDILLDAGAFSAEVSTVISLIGDTPELIRQGRGSVDGVL